MNSLEYFLKNKDADAPKPNIRFYRDNKQLNGSKLLSDGLAPKVSDKTFNTYIDRIQEKPNAKECSVVLDAPVFSPAFIDNVYGLLRKVYSELGYIAPGSFPFLIYGQYKLTPFGMHNHNSTNECDGTFAVALAGEKNIWVWPPDFEKIHPKSQESHDFDEYAAHATKLTAKPGQMIYLTSYHLHVGEAKKKSDLSLFLAIKPDNDVILELFIYFLSNVKTFVPSHEFTKSQDLATKILDDYVDFVQKIKICERDITRLPFDIKHLQECAQRVPFDYPADIRMAIYTTNAIESLNRVIRKAIKKRKFFPTDDSAKKVVYLAIMDASKKWTMPIRNWRAVLNHFIIVFDGRLDEYI